jgi:hypothetical protein
MFDYYALSVIFSPLPLAKECKKYVKLFTTLFVRIKIVFVICYFFSSLKSVNPLMPIATFLGRSFWNLQGTFIKVKFEFHFFIFFLRCKGKKFFFPCIKYRLGTYSKDRAVVSVLMGPYIYNRVINNTL